MTEHANTILLFDFNVPEHRIGWRIINDTVMGGVSQSELSIQDKTALFLGILSPENRGGFASVRSPALTDNLADYQEIVIRIKTDGKCYKLTAKCDTNFDSPMHQARFQIRPNQWQEIYLPFSEFIPTYHGTIVGKEGSLEGAKIRHLGFLISDKQFGSFQLETEWIKAYTNKDLK
jgi:NADH dehydrogenase [ubiquinone] 1 alpha subcomplex assembly factor 1